ncbi:AMP-binding protein, partial [Pseudomonas aeruginosa]
PVDRRQPDRRNREILRQCQAPLALATQAEDLPGQPGEVIAQALATSAAGAAPRPTLDGSEAQYVLFTSGTTAEPKGVVIENHS